MAEECINRIPDASESNNLPGGGLGPRLESTEAFQEPPDIEDVEFRYSLLDKLKSEECISIPEEAKQKSRDPYPYVSFGDEGTTGSVTAYGDLMQITQFLELSRSGFFSVDLPQVPEPYFVQDRTQTLMDIRNRNYTGIYAILQGVDFPDESSEMKVEFIHDRWPLFTTKYDYITFKIQHVAFQGTVFQQYHYSTEKEPFVVPSGFKVSISADLRIRDLDFIDPQYKFNEEDQPSDNYSHRLSKSKHGFILKHTGLVSDDDLQPQKGTNDSVALAVSIFVNGELQELVQDSEEDSEDWYFTKPGKGFLMEPSKPLQITVAFKLLPCKKDWDGGNFPITQHSLREMHKMLEASSFTRLKLSENDLHMDFVMRRNLEHILSVCSTPVPHTCRKGCEDGKLCPEKTAIALTCGDLSGHRIVTSASFFAFQFLLSMFKYLEKFRNQAAAERHPTHCKCNQNDRAACEWMFSGLLQRRIKEVCRMHLIWIGQAEIVDACFGANYWATGKQIAAADTPSLKALTDTPFQLIKLADFRTMFKHSKDEKLVKALEPLLEPLVGPWIKSIDTDNGREFYAFPHPTSIRAGVQEFRLEDHVWIWRAFQSVKSLGLGSKLENFERPLRPGDLNTERAAKIPLSSDYSPTVFQRHVLRRFTTENPVSRQRMLAVARSTSDNRFYLHSRDTALLYTETSSFFAKSGTFWKATIDAQRFHDENQDSRWDNPLRYALAFMMGRKGLQINDRLPDDLSNAAKDLLLQSSSANGLFPGALNAETKEPELFRNEAQRDFYWHRTFEVPYILWHFNSENQKAEDFGMSPPNPSNKPAGQTNEILAISLASGLHSTQLEMKRWMPFNNLIVQKSIVDLSDEWLYNLPSFLDFTPSVNDKDDAEINEKDATDHQFRGVIIDIPKTEHNKKGKSQPYSNEGPWSNFEVLCNKEMYEKLKERRTAKSAKKRLIWSPNANHSTKRLCCLTSTGDEKESLGLFYDRHHVKLKYLFDEVTATANLWTTEFHLSSYELLKPYQDKQMTDLVFLGGDRVIRKAGTSFRFVGDFFDRYWTCHVLESEEDRNQGIATRLKELIEPKRLLPKVERRKEPWRQRKVLELLLFDRMLKKITGRYEDMIAETSRRLSDLFPHTTTGKDDPKNIILVSNGLFSAPMNNDAYLTFSKEWPPFQYTLQVMEEDLKDTLEKIDLWRDREVARQPERPRWTKNDESRYRATITKLTTSNNNEIRDLNHYRATIQSLRTSLTSGLESTRNELSFRSAENVRFFTYITVIFLPLGFATAIFSMGDSSPKRKTLKAMVVTAIITLLLTIVVLVSVHTLEKALFQPVVKISRRLSRRRVARPDKSTPYNGSSSFDSLPEFSERSFTQDERGFPCRRSSGTEDVASESQDQPDTPSGGEHTAGRIPGSWGLWVGDSRRRRETREARMPDDPRLEEGKPN
ncbi:hypothetical protein BU16DRAFT_94470 [Lophium mytilinum]|uniref:Uncharacterized protein n=1 Tax=Lophium mytilinum TaxID=390894 RepID=A0A6A6QPZ0_9PEZI|nr:hypothetical protein BU16DRAFT_94470 [Lophium mytilinum]